MKKELAACLAVLIATVTVIQPVLAAPTPPPVPSQQTAVPPAVPPAMPPAMPPAAASIEAVAESMPPMTTWQRTLAHQLEEVGRSPQAAARAASQLTLEDLQVLIENPDMMQPAGTDPEKQLLFGTIVVVVIVVVVLIAGGAVAFSS